MHDQSYEYMLTASSRSNLNRPFVINRMREYLPIAKRLLNSPYCRPVDYRINAYIEGFTIAGSLESDYIFQ